MADGGGGGEGGRSAEWLPIFNRVEAIVSKSQAQTEALAADRASLAAADRVQRESWEAARRLQRSVEELQAAAREKDAEMDRLRAEAADARKKLQADAGRRMRWEASYVELLLGANQKLAELRDGDMEHPRTCAETPNSKGVESCTNLNRNNADLIATDLSEELRKLKQAYETLGSKKDKEVSALLSEKDSACNQLRIIQHDYAELLKKKKVEAAQATEATQKLQQNLDDLKALAQKKDDEIGRMQAEAVDSKNKLQKMQSLVKEKNDEIQRIKGRHPESIQQRNKDISETHEKSRCGDPAVTISVLENGGLRKTVEEDNISETKTVENNGDEKTVEEDNISETKTVENNGDDETTQKCRRASFMTNDDEKSGSDEDDDEQIGSGVDGDKQSGSDEDGDEQSGSDEDGNEHSKSGDDDNEQSGSYEDVDEDSTSSDDDGQSRSDDHYEDEQKQSGSDEETTNNPAQKPPRNPKRKRDTSSAQISNGKRQSGSNGVANRRWSNKPPPSPLGRRRLVITDGRRRMVPTGNWAQYVNDVKDSLADQPDRRKEFKRFLSELKQPIIFSYVIRGMKDVLDGHPELILRLNEFLPNHYHIGVEKKLRLRYSGCHIRPVVWRQSCNQAETGGRIDVAEEEKQLPEEEQPHQRGVARPCEQLPSASAAAGLIKLKEVELLQRRRRRRRRMAVRKVRARC